MKAQQLAQTLESTLEKAYKEFETTQLDWETKRAPKKWSKKEILGHLNDSALNNIQRFVRILQGDRMNIYYDQDFWVQAAGYQEQGIAEIKKLWKRNNLHIVNLWKNISDDQLPLTIPVKEEEPTLEFLMKDYIDHLNHHLNQIRN